LILNLYHYYKFNSLIIILNFLVILHYITIMRLFIIFISILLGLSLWLNQLFYKKINSIIGYNNAEIAINKQLVENNEEKNWKLDKYFSKLTNNMSLNYKEYIKQYNEQKQRELEEKLQAQKNKCKTIFKNYMNAVVLYPNYNYIRFLFLKGIYNNFINDFYRGQKQKIKYELGSYWYETYYNVRKYNRNQFINWFAFIYNPWKYNIFDLDPIPNIYWNNKYLMTISKTYNLKEIDIKNIKKKKPIYTDVLFYYTVWNSTGINTWADNAVISLVKMYYQIFKKCDKKEINELEKKNDLNRLWRKCWYLTNDDFAKLWDSYLNSVHLKSNMMIIDKDLQNKYNICMWFKDKNVVNAIQSNIKNKQTYFLNELNFKNQVNNK